MKQKLIITTLGIFFTLMGYSQDTLYRTLSPGYDPHYDKVIPDKVFEIGLPLLVLFLISSTIMNIFKTRAENRLKEKALDKEISEATLIALFAEDKSMAKYVYLKWFLILAALGISFISATLLNVRGPQSGYMSIGLISMYMSMAFLIYYFIIRKK